MVLGILGGLLLVFGVSLLSTMSTQNENSGKTVSPQDAPEERSGNSRRPILDSVPEATTKNNHIDAPKRNIPRWERTTAIVVAVGTIGLLVVNIFLWSATKKAANAAQSAADTAHDSLVRTERAWLGLDANMPIKLTELKLGPPRFEAIAAYRIKNFGNSPAFKVASYGWITTDSNEMENGIDEFGCKGSMEFTEGTVPVGGNVKQPPPMGRILFPGQTLERPLGQQGSPFIGPSVPNAKFVWFIGCITYKDEFGKSHWTRFCLLTPEWTSNVVFNEKVPLHMYGMYNDTDDDTNRPQK